MVARLLAQSQNAHTDAKRARRDARTADHLTAIALAQTYRRDAHALDPDHHDSAWRDEQTKGYDHESLLTFYETELAKDPLDTETANTRRVKGLAIVAASVKAVGK